MQAGSVRVQMTERLATPVSKPQSRIAAMIITNEEARRLLKAHRLRVTAPRVAVLRVLADAGGALSHTDVLDRLGQLRWDQATIYRNLVKLRDAGVANVVTRVNGVDRYALAGEHDEDHRHPHFICDDCGRVECLPVSFTLSLDGPWAEVIQEAAVQLSGECPDCR